MIPGWIIGVLTFPGIIVHEAAHLLFCRLRGLAVLDVRFFTMKAGGMEGFAGGWVVTEEHHDFLTSLLVCMGPLLINSVLCVLFCFPSMVPLRIFDRGDVLDYAFIWLGVSIGMHAFPSSGDAAVLWRQATKAAGGGNMLAILTMPLVGAIYVANFLSILWFDVIYAIALGFGLPMLVLERVV